MPTLGKIYAGVGVGLLGLLMLGSSGNPKSKSRLCRRDTSSDDDAIVSLERRIAVVAAHGGGAHGGGGGAHGGGGTGGGAHGLAGRGAVPRGAVIGVVGGGGSVIYYDRYGRQLPTPVYYPC